MAGCQIINIESGRPTVDVARARLNQSLRNAKSAGYTVAKVIHGYGSSGTGGAIKADVQRVLQQKRSAGQIKAYVKGEDFSPFDASARLIVERCPQMARDIDYNRQNHGVTIVLL
ncbi:Smr/MutS family protein [Clostridiaceae bacterium NSJ-31]|uniref:Smr/MutS family protein n=1 Tax=Ligaoa zhengdingensis TaxID=2763658 RepID=A0A926DYT3_9FIRM|nr:Smr/MutS family protein [Ligaoa zhengdingensis]MBC8547336.1 Smr/MutS family protein [Ligaoa zhengdingensis]